MRPIPVGAKGTYTLLVTPAHLANQFKDAALPIEINRNGVAVFLVEQNVHAALTLAQRAYILETGCIVGEGSGAELLQDPHVRRAYLGPLAAPEYFAL